VIARVGLQSYGTIRFEPFLFFRAQGAAVGRLNPMNGAKIADLLRK
jgi:hypothetical protein